MENTTSQYGLSETNPVAVASDDFDRTIRNTLAAASQPYDDLDPVIRDTLAAAAGKAGKDEYLKRLRCPKNRGITWTRHGSIVGKHMKPIDKYAIECKCGRHRETIYLDAYSSGPLHPIGIQGWTLSDEEDYLPATEPSDEVMGTVIMVVIIAFWLGVISGGGWLLWKLIKWIFHLF